MPTTRINEEEVHRHIPDRAMCRLAADYLRELGLNPDRLVLQAGWLGERYVVRVRFPELKIPSANNAQKIQLTVEHSLDLTTGPEAVIIGGKKELLLTWVLERLYETLAMAYHEWTVIRKRPWPSGFPKPEYKFHQVALERVR